jgi:hypothetical protein
MLGQSHEIGSGQAGSSNRQQYRVLGRKMAAHMADEPYQHLAVLDREIRSSIETVSKGRAHLGQKTRGFVKVTSDPCDRASNFILSRAALGKQWE